MSLTAGLKAHFMREALLESRRALPACRPNPPVGCVIVDGETVIARGFTGPPGEAHAEVAALTQLNHGDPSALALFVTLEPCSFTGRTPPCVSALLRSGLRRVLVGIVDPHPRNRGRGLEMLRAAGISVEIGVLEAEIAAFLTPYLQSSDDS